MTSNLQNVMQQWLTNWKAFYTANGLPGNAHPTSDQIDMAARAATFGDAVGTAINSAIGPLQGFADGVLVGDALFLNHDAPSDTLGISNAAATTVIASNPALQGGTGALFTLTTGVDVGPGFHDGAARRDFHCAFAATNTLNAGDNLQDSAGDGTLNLSQVAGAPNPPNAAFVTMNGISTANIQNASGGLAGFSGVITGLTRVTLLAGSNGDELLGTAGQGLNTALATVEIQANQNFHAWMTAAALGAATNTVAVNLNGAGVTTHVTSM